MKGTTSPKNSTKSKPIQVSESDSSPTQSVRENNIPRNNGKTVQIQEMTQMIKETLAAVDLMTKLKLNSTDQFYTNNSFNSFNSFNFYSSTTE